MAINQVYMPEKQQSGLAKLGQIAQMAAPLFSIANPAIGAGMAFGGSMTQMAENQPRPQQVDTMSAMRRRQMSEAPDQSISEAIAALDSMNLPDDQYRRYKTPLYQAMQKQGGMS